MSNILRRNALILLAVLGISIWAVVPPSEKIRFGKDVAGGVSLVYGVTIKPSDPSDTLSKVVDNTRSRLDPDGTLEISVVPMGGDHVEITMPLPTEAIIKKKRAFEAKLAEVGTASMSRDELERIAVMPEPQRTDAIKLASKGEPVRAEKITVAVHDYEALRAARAEFGPAENQVKTIEEEIRNNGGENSTDPIVANLKTARTPAREKADALRSAAAKAALAFEASSKDAVSVGLSPNDLRHALGLSNKAVKLLDKNEKVAELDSPRKRAIDDILKQFPDQKSKIDAAIAEWNIYEKSRTGLDDPQDVKRILRGAGVLSFRITVPPGAISGENDLREQLRQGGPRAIKSEDAQFFKVNKIEQWLQTVDDLEALKKSPAAYFARRQLIAEEYKGAYYVLCWDKRGSRLTPDDGAWMLAKARPGTDQLGRPSIDFEMDTLGGDKLGRLTKDNVHQAMAVLLDDEVYTAPTLQSAISNHGQITGSFSQSEIDYIVRVLSAGSLKAKLSEEPLSESVVGPNLGAENLNASFKTGIIAFALVAAFMIVYYFFSGFLAVIALLYTSLLVVAMMALNKSAFTLPGIAGVVLTFGQAVDSNVLVYERMREELQLGHDLRTSVRLAFSRALAPIVDGNISNLIICVVLGFFGTEEIRGFAITLGIGVVTTLFSTLFFTRFMFNVLIEKFGWRHASQLPMAVPAVQRLFSPHIDWMRHRHVLLGILVAFLVGSGWIVYIRGADLLGMEFRAGTAVTITFKQTPGPDNTFTQVKRSRHDVETGVKAIGEAAPKGSTLKQLSEAQIIAVNPDANTDNSGTFTIKSKITDAKLVQDALVTKFIDDLDVLQALKFDSSDRTADRAPVFPMTGANVRDAIDRTAKSGATEAGGLAPEYEGGVAIRLENIDPPVSKQEIDKRLTATRQKHDFSDIAARTWETRVLEGSDAKVTAMVVLVRDADVRYEDRRRWESELRDREWALTLNALTQSETLASVQSFSPAIASKFATQGVVCMILSLLGLTIYVFVRFGTLRWAIAATLPLFADVVGIVGLLGVAEYIYVNYPSVASKLGLLPFDLDLAQIAAVLTIVGYSLNDKIIILDRIRENKGKLPYASYKVVNDSINQTLSRTVITAGAHMITTIVLYLYGGEAVRGFAYTFNLGVLLGTFTSIVSTPLVWSHKFDPTVSGGRGSAGTGSHTVSTPGTNGSTSTIPSHNSVQG